MVNLQRVRETGAADPILQRIADEDKVPWYRKPNLRSLYLMLFPACMAVETTSGFDSQLINALQIVPSWISYFDNPQGSLQGIIAAAYSLGAILSLPFIPIVNDKFGRRWSIFGGSAIMVVGAILQGFAPNVAAYIIARMILGFGIPTCIVSGSALIAELAFPVERPVMTSLFNVSYFLGSIVAAGICFGTNNIASNWAWRIPSLLQVVPSLVQMAFVLFLPESPRWLVARDRGEEAYAILVKYHAEGDTESEFAKAEMAEIQTTLTIELEAAKESWFDILKTSGMRKRAVISAFLGLFTQWSGNTLISYYLGDLLAMIGFTDSVTKQKFNLGSSCWALVCGIVTALLVKRFRRRVMYMTCVISLLVVYIGWTISMRYAVKALNEGQQDKAVSGLVLFWILAYSPCYNIGYNAMTYTYMTEIWPYALRSRGISFFQLFGRLAGFFTTFVNPIGIDNASWKYLISYCCWLGFEVVFVYFMFPETAGRTIEELSFLFEDRQLAEQTVFAVEKVIHHEDMNQVPVSEKKPDAAHVETNQNV